MFRLSALGVSWQVGRVTKRNRKRQMLVEEKEGDVAEAE